MLTEYRYTVAGRLWEIRTQEGFRASYEYDAGGEGTKDIYRAVSPEEYEDIMTTQSLRGRQDGRSYEAKQIGNDFNEILELANQPIMQDTTAIVKVTIPESVYNQLNHMPLDVRSLKSGAVTVEPDMLDIFNESIINIEHVY